jgi:hypothetical protein
MADCRYAEYHFCQVKIYAKRRKIGLYAECHYAECCGAKLYALSLTELTCNLESYNVRVIFIV